jgi:hypothetical protein
LGQIETLQLPGEFLIACVVCRVNYRGRFFVCQVNDCAGRVLVVRIDFNIHNKPMKGDRIAILSHIYCHNKEYERTLTQRLVNAGKWFY